MPSPDEYAHAVTRQATARACAALGFKTAQTDVLDCLSDVMAQYLQKVRVRHATSYDVHMCGL
jgi:hypothetical protein